MDDLKVELNFGSIVSVLLFTALGIIQAWMTGSVPWYIGGVIGFLIYLIAFIGIIPVVGVFAYAIIAQKLMEVTHTTALTWPYYLGAIYAAIYTIIMSIILALALFE